MDDVLREQRERLLSISDELLVLEEALAEFLSGGKRLRAAFCYWGWQGADCGEASDDVAMQVAAALEFVQASALIHDDVMDGSETRRGLPAVHHRFANMHRAHGWLGSADAFGTGAAILIGDLCLSWADELMLGADLPASARAEVKRVYDLMRTELMAGQYLDLQEQARGGGSIERARKVVEYKTSKYTIERPLHLGAALAGGDAALYEAYSAYGRPLGEAFQLRDDILGVFGDPRETGKPAGDDLREGKRTVLVATAFEHASASQRTAMLERLGDPALDATGIDLLRDIITDTGALSQSERTIEELLANAVTAANSPAIAPAAREMLTQLAYAATRRTV